MKRCKRTQGAKKTWYTLNLQVFTNFIFRVPSLTYCDYIISFDYLGYCILGILTESALVQHELGLAADEGVRQLVEQSDVEVSAVEKATAMKDATKKRAKQLHKKMSKLVALANPDLTDGWLREVLTLFLNHIFESHI
jgi:hypothetical protein